MCAEALAMSEKSVLRALILEDRIADAELLANELDCSGFQLEWQRVDTEVDFVARLSPPPDVILADCAVPGLDAQRALQVLENLGLNVPFIVVSGAIDEEEALATMRLGATDYLLKDRLGRLGLAVKHALLENELRRLKGQAEDGLQASDARFLAFMQHSPALAFIKDDSGRIVYINKASQDAVDTAAQLCADTSDFENGEPSRTIQEVTIAGGQLRQMLSLRFPFDDVGGHRLMGGVSVDITDQKAAERALSEALTAKDVLLGELHHRVKNNLQTISSLLNMQAELMSDDDARQALRDAKRRVYSLALLHEQMNGGSARDEIDFGEYARRLIRELFDSFGPPEERISLRLALDAVPLIIDQTIPCSLILNELLTNSLKYAFPGERSGEILVSLRCPHGRSVVMTVADNGVGLPPDVGERCSKSLGLRIVDILAGQLGGQLDRQSGKGVSSTITFTRLSKV
jgi:two-component sensor histidine kinase